MDGIQSHADARQDEFSQRSLLDQIALTAANRARYRHRTACHQVYDPQSKSDMRALVQFSMAKHEEGIPFSVDSRTLDPSKVGFASNHRIMTFNGDEKAQSRICEIYTNKFGTRTNLTHGEEIRTCWMTLAITERGAINSMEDVLASGHAKENSQ